MIVNVFAGSERSTVEMRLGTSDAWSMLTKVDRPDPALARIKESEKSEHPPNGMKMPALVNSAHLWAGYLPADPPVGLHVIEVRTTDMYGRTYSDKRVVWIRSYT